MIFKDNTKVINLPYNGEVNKLFTDNLINKYGMWGRAWYKHHAVLHETEFVEVVFQMNTDGEKWNRFIEDVRDIPDYPAWV